MRVTQVAPTAFGSDGLYGGGERYPLELGRALARHVACRLITFGPSARLARDDSGLEIVVLKKLAELKHHPAHPLARGLRRALDGADVVHAHHMRSAPSRIAALHTKLTGTPRVVTDHGLGGGGWSGLLPRLFDLFLTVSRYSAQTLRAPESKTRIVYGGADPARFFPDDGGRDGVLFVGRITPHKGIDVLIRALPQGVDLVVAGSPGHDPRPPERDYPRFLERLAATEHKTVTFLKTVAESELPELYRRACVVVLPSVHRTCYGRQIAISELLGLSLIEAMASATPVVCSNVGGLPEVVRDGETGFVVEPGDTAALNAAISEVTGDAGLARRLGTAGCELFRAQLTWERCAERCLAAYAELYSGAA